MLQSLGCVLCWDHIHVRQLLDFVSDLALLHVCQVHHINDVFPEIALAGVGFKCHGTSTHSNIHTATSQACDFWYLPGLIRGCTVLSSRVGTKSWPISFKDMLLRTKHCMAKDLNPYILHSKEPVNIWRRVRWASPCEVAAGCCARTTGLCFHCLGTVATCSTGLGVPMISFQDSV